MLAFVLSAVSQYRHNGQGVVLRSLDLVVGCGHSATPRLDVGRHHIIFALFNLHLLGDLHIVFNLLKIAFRMYRINNCESLDNHRTKTKANHTETFGISKGHGAGARIDVMQQQRKFYIDRFQQTPSTIFSNTPR
eukprot:TRINITY_DN65615_c0_g1_i3.p3 TRINITY_DN65615_c0_g1~~TRINITY_DN65615_c0_g1_i3.p3  ORF type:complete len:135 (-),score=32.74 TRINITY_DN65615_c0_g1_i3:145-549(-)